MLGAFRLLAFQGRPTIPIENRQVRNALNIVRIILHDDRTGIAPMNIVDEFFLKLRFFLHGGSLHKKINTRSIRIQLPAQPEMDCCKEKGGDQTGQACVCEPTKEGGEYTFHRDAAQAWIASMMKGGRDYHENEAVKNITQCMFNPPQKTYTVPSFISVRVFIARK